MALNEVQKKERSEYLEKNLQITECSQRKPYVFVSYASDNWEIVFKNAVVPLQQKYGLRVYADKAFDKVNDKWIVPMLRNIRGADVIVAFVSQSYIESYSCFLELLTAVNNKKQIVFVSLEEELHLGDTTDQPDVERGVKNEIINQGSNIATNTNNTSNDLMRAMKSAYTSLSTLLEQDALAKYDISDAFINFFRDASINRKTINDLKAVKRTINSVSSEVFDKSLIFRTEQELANVVRPVIPTSEPFVPQESIEPVAQPVTSVSQPATSQETIEPAVQPDVPQEIRQTAVPVFRFDEPKIAIDKKKRMANLIAGGVCAIAIVGIILVVILTKNINNDDETNGTDNSETQNSENGSHIEDDSASTEQEILVYDNGDVYKGELKDGQPDGYGIMTDIKGNIYEGEWKDGVRNGQGTATYASGSVYEGGWKDDQPDGYGIYTWADGDVYEGEWIDGRGNGQGTMTYADGTVKTGTWENGIYVGDDNASIEQETITYENGDVYKGELKDDQPDGYGTMTYADGIVYEGEWKDGKRTGQGTQTMTNGDVYKGEFIDGNYNGQGTYTWANGNEYEGEWKNGKQTGQGTMTYADGVVYEGEWKDGKRTGQGTQTMTNGDVYKGEFVDGNYNGQGTYTWANGNEYEGEWKNGKQTGQGTLTSADGTVIAGTWKEGEFVD